MITENGKPILTNPGSRMMDLPLSNAAQKVFGVMQVSSSTSIGCLLGSSNDAFLLLAKNQTSSSDLRFSRSTTRTNAAAYTGTTRADALTALTNQTLLYVDFTTTATLGDINFGFAPANSMMEMQECIIYPDTATHTISDIETDINDYYEIIVNDEVATSGFLFDYPNAAVAYSVRQLNNNAEYAMQVERSDGRAKNIGFDGNGDLDTQAIIDFAGASVATISAWYDQSGNQVHMAQNSPTLQPMIYDGASVITDNNKPCIEFLGASNLILQTANATPSVSQPTTYFVTANKPNHSSYLWDGISSRQAQGDATWIFAGGLSYGFYPNSELGSQVLFTALFNGASSVGRINSSQTATGNPGSNALGGIKIISKEGNKYQEFVVYGADQTSQFTPIESDINTYYDMYTMYNPDPATSGFLFDYPNASTAYSVRQLNNNATVSMRVRRAVAPFDEQDIGFVNGDLDEAAIVAFGGSDALTVSAWYDQSGNQRHATQIAPNSQPQIYNGAAVLTENGRPAVQFDGSNDYLSLTSTAVTNSVCQILVSVYDTSVSSLKMPLGGGPTTWWQHYSANRIRINTTSGQVIFASGLSNGTQYLGFMNGNSGAYTFHLNGTSKFSGTVGNWYIDTIGRGLNSNTYAFNDPIQEVILYESEKSSSRTAIEDDIMTYYQIP